LQPELACSAINMDRVQHFEIPCDDMEKTKKFYSEIFGWKIFEIPGMGYHMINTAPTDEQGMIQEKGAINGGITQRDETAKSPIIMITVENLEESMKKIEEGGGKIVMPKAQVGDMGLYARISDPEGNIIGIWQNLK